MTRRTLGRHTNISREAKCVLPWDRGELCYFGGNAGQHLRPAECSCCKYMSSLVSVTHYQWKQSAQKDSHYLISHSDSDSYCDWLMQIQMSAPQIWPLWLTSSMFKYKHCIPLYCKTRSILVYYILLLQNTTHTHPFNGPFSGTTQVSRDQKGKPIWILLKQEIVSGNGIS